jgi:predicted glycoside hydrolase/deacetylase ChbG (UPF0249 family)
MNTKGRTVTAIGESPRGSGDVSDVAAALILNADDWGRDLQNTERTLQCVLRGTVSSVSAMVFMEDSDRAAAIALDCRIDAGLHLNFTTPFSAPGTPTQLVEHQRRLAQYLRKHRLAQILFHPGLNSSFRYVVAAQLDEFNRIYRTEPERIDGHHHMHLCANILLEKLLPKGTVVRRNFSFRSGDKSYGNRLYRRIVDRMLAKRHSITDYFFSLVPLQPLERLERIFSLSRKFVVEVETHPVNEEEYRFLTEDGVSRWRQDYPVAPRFCLSGRNRKERERET